eukprot:1191760-Prorocentrum_minimum.AAC.2
MMWKREMWNDRTSPQKALVPFRLILTSVSLLLPYRLSSYPLGALYANLGRRSEAVGELKVALGIDPTHAVATKHLQELRGAAGGGRDISSGLV